MEFIDIVEYSHEYSTIISRLFDRIGGIVHDQ